MLMVIIFEEELGREDLDLLFEDLEETSCKEVLAFDDNAKVVINIPDVIPDPNYTATIEEYWTDVINETLNPCCDPQGDSGFLVYRIKTLQQFRKDSNDLNNGYGPFEDLLKDLKD